VKLDNGMQLQSGQAQFAVDDRVELVCRPEHVEISVSPIDGPNTFQGKVDSLYFLGNLADVTIDVGGVAVRCQTSPPKLMAQGHPVWLRIAPEQVVLLRTGSATES
jgi:iron(III) transport system ATP-binding protein/putative spermidine/putrescine transport system ATP-binding protein